MTLRIVRLGSERLPGEGLRIGTVRRPPRGVPKSELAARDFYDVWLPNLAPSEALLRAARATLDGDDARAWKRFERRYRTEMRATESRALLDVLALLSHRADFSVGCYCAEESRCHRSILRSLFTERGAELDDGLRRGA
jgi:uncharacterized protein YeaO (DUF488 family)